MATIPARAIVTINPSVLAAGGRALDINTIMITKNERVQAGVVKSFNSALDVEAYFGPASQESYYALIYFNGFDNSRVKPGRLYFARYNLEKTPAWLHGGSILGMTISQLKAIPAGTISLLINGTQVTSSSINLSGATSFSNAAQIIQSAFSGNQVTVSYDVVTGGFVIRGTTSGVDGTMEFPTANELVNRLRLTLQTGALISQGADPEDNPAGFLNNLTRQTQNWVNYMLLFDPDKTENDWEIENEIKMEFAMWAARSNHRYAFVCWDTDASPTASLPATTSMGQKLMETNASGTFLLYAPDPTLAAFICGAAASIDFRQHNGRITFAFKRQSGLLANVVNETISNNLIGNGYNFYGAYATANDQFVWIYPGQVSGEFRWFDSYINQVWLNSELQLALMVLLDNAKSIPYNPAGYQLIHAACLDAIAAALNFGAIRSNVPLSNQQASIVNGDAGIRIDDVLFNQGWFLQVLDAAPQVRQQRGSPPMSLWYMDGGAVQKIVLGSIMLL